MHCDRITQHNVYQRTYVQVHFHWWHNSVLSFKTTLVKTLLQQLMGANFSIFFFFFKNFENLLPEMVQIFEKILNFHIYVTQILGDLVLVHFSWNMVFVWVPTSKFPAAYPYPNQTWVAPLGVWARVWARDGQVQILNGGPNIDDSGIRNDMVGNLWISAPFTENVFWLFSTSKMNVFYTNEWFL